MGSATTELILKLKDEASRGIAAIGGSVDGVGQKAEKTHGLFGKMAGGMKSGLGALTGPLRSAAGGMGSLLGNVVSLGTPIGLATVGIGKLTDYMGDAVNAARADRQETDALNTALAASIPNYNAHDGVVDKLINNMGKLAYSDSEVRASLEKTAFRLHDEKLASDAVAAAAGLAREKHIDLATASDIVAKAMDGSTGALAKMGVEVTKGATAQEVLAQVQKQTAGVAEQYASSQEGAAQRQAIAQGELAEKIGSVVLPVMDQLKTIGLQVADMLTTGIGGAIDFLQPLVEGAFTAISAAVTPVFDVLKQLFGVFSTAVQGGDISGLVAQFGPFGDIIQSLATYVGSVVSAFQTFFSDIGSGKDVLQSGITLIGSLAEAISKGLGEAVNWVVTTGLPLLLSKIGEWAKAFVDWVGPQIPILLGKLGELAGQAWGWITGTALPTLVQKIGEWAKAFVDWVGPQIPILLSNLGKLASDVWNWLINTALPTLISKLGQWGKAFIDWVGPQIMPLLGKLAELLGQVTGWLITVALPAIISKLVEWGGAFLNWVAKDVLPTLPQKLGEIANAVWTWIINDALPGITTKLGEWAKAFLDWIGTSVLPFLGEKLGQIWTAITSWVGTTVKNIGAKVAEIGKGIVDGIGDGIKKAWDGLVQWLSGMVKDALPQFIKDWLGIKSPSTVMAAIAEQIPAGMQKGMEKSFPDAVSAAQNGVGDIVDATKQALEMFNPNIEDSFAAVFLREWDPNKEGGFKKLFNTSLHEMGNATRIWVDMQKRWWNDWSAVVTAAIQAVIDKMYQLPVLPSATGGSGGGTGDNVGTGGGGTGRGILGHSTGGGFVFSGTINVYAGAGANGGQIGHAVVETLREELGLATRMSSRRRGRG